MYRLDYSNYLMAFLIGGLCEQRDYFQKISFLGCVWLCLAFRDWKHSGPIV